MVNTLNHNIRLNDVNILMSTITNNWLDQAKTKLACGNGTFSSFEFRHIKLGIAIEDLLERDATILDSPIGLNSFTLGWIYNKIQCGVMLDGNMIAQAEVIVSSNNLSLTDTSVTSVIGSGSVYNLTNTQAAVNLGGTDPVIVLTAGRYLISAKLHVALAAATITTQSVTAKLRRTNNTAGDITDGSVNLGLPVVTTNTSVLSTIIIPDTYYETTSDDDSITLFAALSATAGAGQVTITGASIVAKRI